MPAGFRIDFFRINFSPSYRIKIDLVLTPLFDVIPLLLGKSSEIRRSRLMVGVLVVFCRRRREEEEGRKEGLTGQTEGGR